MHKFEMIKNFLYFKAYTVSMERYVRNVDFLKEILPLKCPHCDHDVFWNPYEYIEHILQCGNLDEENRSDFPKMCPFCHDDIDHLDIDLLNLHLNSFHTTQANEIAIDPEVINALKAYQESGILIPFEATRNQLIVT